MKTLRYFLIFFAGCCFAGVVIAALLMAYGVYESRMTPTQPQSITQNGETIEAITPPTEPTLSNPSNTSTQSQSYFAGEVIRVFQSAGLPISEIVTYTAETDLNALLGRPSQYIEKVGWKDSRIVSVGVPGITTGGTLEIFLTADDLQARKANLESHIKAGSMPVEYSYDFGVILLRLTYKLTPDQAQGYENVLKAFTSGEALPIVAATASPSPSSVQPTTVLLSNAPATAYNRYMVGNAQPALPPPSGNDFDVVVLKQEDSVLRLFIRNNTTVPIRSIGINAVARAVDGSMLGTTGGSGDGPNLVNPGEIVYTAIAFSNLTLPSDAQFEFDVNSSPAAGEQEYGDLTITEHNLVQSNYVG